jgi:hypothetical protein
MGRKDAETIEPLYFIPPERLNHFKYQRQKKKREPISISPVCFFYFFFFPDKFREYCPLIREDTFLIRAGRLRPQNL